MFDDEEAYRVEYNHRNVKHLYLIARLINTAMKFILSITANPVLLSVEIYIGISEPQGNYLASRV